MASTTLYNSAVSGAPRTAPGQGEFRIRGTWIRVGKLFRARAEGEGGCAVHYHLWGSGDNAHNFAHTARTDKRTVASDSPCKVRPIVVFSAKNARLGGVLDFPKSPPGRRCKSGTTTHFRKPRSAATFSVSRAVRNCPSNVHPMPVRANSGGEAQTPSRLPRAVTHS